MRIGHPSGLALLVVVGVLGVLAVVATAFTTMAQLERRASRQRLHATKAYLLARSGIEDVLARIAAGQDPDAAGARYGGEDFDDDGSLSPGRETDAEVFRKGRLNRGDCPARHALRPSFFARDLAGDPALRPVEGRLRGYSGTLGGDGIPEGNPYALKVMPQAGLYVNGGDPAAPPTEGYNAVLRRILGTLAEAVDREDGTSGDGPVVQADGYTLIDSRPRTGWTSWDEVRDIAFSGSQEKLDALREYLALEAWVDAQVIRPNASPALVGAQPTTWAEIRMAHGGPPGFEPRAPVALAWARSRKSVLLALLSGLRGIYLDEADASNEARGNLLGTLRSAELAPVDTYRVADCLVASTSDLDTWEAFDAFCDAIPDAALSGTPDLRQAKRDLLKANFNPNSDLNKFNPNRTLWKTVDKQDLLAYSTEFGLPGVHGHEISSLGRILDAGGRLLACRECRLEVGGPSVLRLTTQRDFVCDSLGPRLPGAYLSRSAGLTLTWGAKLPAVGGLGTALQAYPEPYADPGTGLQINPADYDGNLQLATVETTPEYAYGAGGPPQDMKFLACFDASLDLESPGTDVPGPNLPDAMQVSTAELGLGLLDPVKPNTLHPDGVYSEKDRTPSYHDAGNAHGYHGLMSFWIKANYDSLKTMPPSLRQRGRRFVAWTNYRGGGQRMGTPDQLFALGESSPILMFAPVGILGQFELGHDKSDIDQEHRFTAWRRTFPHRWHLVTFSWDFQSSVPPAPHPSRYAGEMVVDDGMGTSDVGSASDYGFANTDPALAADITEPDAYGSHRIWLGQARDREYDVADNMGGGADATLDEFAIYDLGVLGADDEAETKGFAQARYREGRYYKGARYRPFDGAPVSDEAASYLSPPLRLPAGAFLRQVGWSWRRPAELPGDYAAVELVREDLLAPAYLWDAAESASRSGPGGIQRWEVRRRVPGAFRARVLFLRRPSPDTDAFDTLGPDTPLLDSPVFDDLTLLYDPPGGPRLLGWDGGAT